VSKKLNNVLILVQVETYTEARIFPKNIWISPYLTGNTLRLAQEDAIYLDYEFLFCDTG
jgi:hypothetical protein